MKQMTCAAVGGPADCTHVFTGNTAEEMIKNGMEHVAQAHPEMMADIKKMTPEETSKWMAEFQPKFNAAPEME